MPDPRDRVFTGPAGSFILIQDEVAAKATVESPIKILDPTPRHAAVYVPAAEVERMRERHRGVRVYGLWQVLLFNGLVDPTKHDCFIVYSDRATETGNVLAVAEGYLKESQPFFGGLPAGVVADNACEFDRLDFAKLSLPPKPILLPSEVAAIQRGQLRNLAILGLGAAGAAVVLAVIADVALKARANGFQKTATAIQVEAGALQDQINAKKAVKDPLTPEARFRYHAILTRLAELAAESAQPAILPFALDGGTEVSATVAALPTTLSYPVVAVSTPASAPTVTFSIDGAGDSALQGGGP